MSAFFKAMSSFVVMIAMAFLSVSSLITHLQISYAQSYHNSIVAEIESSDFNTATINRIIARNNIYHVTVTNAGIYEDKKAYEVKTTYNLSMPIFVKNTTDTLVTYAR